ncbi:hypothetical protein [Streptomyces sp. FH025]|uniref:hypothetical protein n=1 Tax=Streptomyces sp. FH025 TaxID=2815937 RepID=UPI001FAF770E|nr:hypothetical protein [Streptomyces sp. FH025]
MLLLGLLLMAASGAFVGLLIADNLSGGPDYQVTILGHDLVTLNSLSVFLAGVALALIFCLGLAMMWLARRLRARRLRRAAGPPRAHTDADSPSRPGSAGSGAAAEEPAGHGGRVRHLFGH